MNAIEVENLFKSYASVKAVNGVSFTLSHGEILGLIGPNGAGKSSTIKMILDFIKPSTGRISVLGGAMSNAIKSRIGYLPEEKGLYRSKTAVEQIVYLASLKGVDRKTARTRTGELLERTGLAESANRKVKDLSKGMGQMIQLIVTLIHDPELIILDEPFSGLDPVNTELLRTIVGEHRDRGKAIILSTHQMNQVEELCDRVLMIDHGKALLYGDLSETTARFRRKSVLVEIEGQLPDIPGVAEVKRDREAMEIVPAEGVTPMMLLDRLRERDVSIKRFEIATPSLHEIFLKVVGGNDE